MNQSKHDYSNIAVPAKKWRSSHIKTGSFRAIVNYFVQMYRKSKVLHVIFATEPTVVLLNEMRHSTVDNQEFSVKLYINDNHRRVFHFCKLVLLSILR